jgi:hypothetical protein
MYYVASETQIPSILSFMLLVTILIFIGIADWVVLAPPPAWAAALRDAGLCDFVW